MSRVPSVRRMVRSVATWPPARFRWSLLGLVVLLVLATRLLSFSFSPLPFNNDGMTESRIADDILASGGLDYPEGASYVGTHSTITPFYNVALAFCASILGVSAFSVAQFVIAGVSLVTVLGTYLLSFEVTKSRTAALGSSMVLSLLGSFVYLTASTWKAALGVSLFVVLAYAYCNRSDKRFMILEIIALITLPFVHHLVAVLAYAFVAYMTVWSVLAAIRNRRFRARHVTDISVVAAPAVAAYSYYHFASLDRLDYLADGSGFLAFGVIFFLTSVVFSLVMIQRRHLRFTLSWVPAILVMVFFLVDFTNPLFSYSAGTPYYVVVLASASCLVLGVGWYGYELIVESKSRYRAVPLGLFLPILTLVCFALFMGLGLRSHQILYRSFDFVYVSVALGVGVVIMHMESRPRVRLTLVAFLIVALLLSFPFGHATGTLTGVRHDTQEYEVDALGWLAENAGSNCTLFSDERLSYNARAIFDMVKRNDLPYMLNLSRYPPPGSYSLYEYEWSVVGVNDYPRGHPVIDANHVEAVMADLNVVYVGGPMANQAVIISA